MDIQTELARMERELRIRNYSPRTIKAYLYGLKEYCTFADSDIRQLDVEDVKSFLEHKAHGGASAQTRSVMLGAIKFYYKNVVGTTRPITIGTGRREHRLPVVLS